MAPQETTFLGPLGRPLGLGLPQWSVGRAGRTQACRRTAGSSLRQVCGWQLPVCQVHLEFNGVSQLSRQGQAPASSFKKQDPKADYPRRQTLKRSRYFTTASWTKFLGCKGGPTPQVPPGREAESPGSPRGGCIQLSQEPGRHEVPQGLHQEPLQEIKRGCRQCGPSSCTTQVL
ncbi:uncharacterized protein LOC116459184 isoform X2 [Hylobates moloch]|uniref:uncharacterized protein LOC116459184 isoform X2 n=1 Tax=Hylobates moloch TaxID=81572 RepID=UPI00267743FE|nr:uncharacterized protein LOC116459184 isoform X2 [Hylobates moloch]